MKLGRLNVVKTVESEDEAKKLEALGYKRLDEDGNEIEPEVEEGSIEELKALKQENESLEKENKALKGENESLKAEIEELKNKAPESEGNKDDGGKKEETGKKAKGKDK